MRIVQLTAENFKRLEAVEITPTGDVVTISGKNGAGKSSVLDAIWVGLVGKSVAPPKPIRAGQEECRIRLDLGEIVITRRFADKDGKITDSVKVEDAEGRRYPTPQTMLDALLGQIGFDPFGFCQMKPDKQAETLLAMVPLEIDIDEFAALDQRDYDERRDINRREKELRAQIQAYDLPAKLPEALDRDALLKEIGDAANKNSEIQREEMARERQRIHIDQVDDSARNRREQAQSRRDEAARLVAEAEEFERDAKAADEEIAQLEEEFAALPPLPEPVDTDAIREQIREADQVAEILAADKSRKSLIAQADVAEKKSAELTKAMTDREAQRNAALAKARMPINGLGFAIEGKTARVTFGGVPFEQASTAEQLRASTAIAMASSPDLRVLRIKDGSLLDDDSMAILSDMARDNDFQLWIERVGTGGVGIVIENGNVKSDDGKPEPKPKAQPKASGDKLL